MADVQGTAAAAPQVIRREDYTPPAWRVPEIALEFDLDPARTVVRSRMQVERAGPGPLKLDHGGQQIVSIRVDGASAEYRDEGGRLILDLPRDSHAIEIVTEISPEANTELMGLYASGGLLCTQCEAEGFRRITPFPDRPDVLSRYSVRMTADRVSFPVLLANGDRVGGGDLPGGRHWAEWRDPFFKPCYLFALVAGDLKANRDHFTTMSGRKVELGIWVREADLPKTAHAMQALKDAMAWDERVYGREYDLDVFNIVAVSDFNFGAMENKGLNIFNSRYILADPETATDADFDAIAAVVAHEYFHNWSGNRVTCRDWFQLSLKEGLTVFRDQQFSADHGSAAVERINQVRMLRAAQFQEDAGPLAHPVRPDSYIEIGNFYTATVYNKGAELIRMMATMLRPERFRRGTDLYFERHDGQAVTCDDFVKAMEDGGGIDLSQFRLWYSQAGTPKVKATVRQDGQDAIVSLEQTVPSTPGQSDKQPMPIPLRMALFGAGTGAAEAGERLVVLDKERADIRFEGVGEAPVLSINRGFSAPVIVESDRDAAALALLSAHDDDPFARYEALQQLMLDTLIARVEAGAAEFAPVVDAVRLTLENPALDKAFVAEAVLPPSEAFIGDRMATVDPEAIHQAREALRAELGRLLEGQWRAAYLGSASNRFELTPAAKGARRLRSIALGFLMAGGAEDAPALAWDQFQGATNMTDRQGALAVLANSDAAQREDALAAFYARHKDDALVLDKWFTTQALSTRADALEQVLKLSQHPDFTLSNPNRARSLVGAFSANQRGFHSGEGRGYRFLADNIVALDAINPQTAAKFVAPLGRWRRFGETRGALMRAELERIVAKPGLSKDVFEQASKSLI
ncbi:aminopeptidase N [Sphingomonas sp. MAH-20]|uniref:Aminopeptidase N n=1 Tax=Sphingomonas horti TaxID=2682842 RepID=A0A6I4IZ94_9SPHN|nr:MULTISPECIES: aminopeptidase N [Sphingomonas]MBA2918518.1 aminopeptidase N [Sphingomonas sp. CGMCC 1.13658]MVO77485.1 aminopeptidase N [Sphingomonas horti]